jgi:hypothetical protein
VAVPTCAKCGLPVQSNEEFCPNRHWHGYPNVKMALEERPALLQRSQAAAASLQALNLQHLGAGIRRICRDAAAVLCMDVEFLLMFLKNERLLYATYAKQVAAGARRPALPGDDKTRVAIEGLLFGSAAPVVYAALAPRGRGLSSYGALALRLKEPAIDERASCLEENSYAFARRHPGNLPSGYRAAWDDRDTLALAKIGARTQSPLTAAEMQRRLFFSEGRRDTDEFVEVHIWGELSIHAVEAIQVLEPPRDAEERDLFRIAEIRARRRNLQWT